MPWCSELHFIEVGRRGGSIFLSWDLFHIPVKKTKPFTQKEQRKALAGCFLLLLDTTGFLAVRWGSWNAFFSRVFLLTSRPQHLPQFCPNKFGYFWYTEMGMFREIKVTVKLYIFYGNQDIMLYAMNLAHGYPTIQMCGYGGEKE